MEQQNESKSQDKNETTQFGYWIKIKVDSSSPQKKVAYKNIKLIFDHLPTFEEIKEQIKKNVSIHEKLGQDKDIKIYFNRRRIITAEEFINYVGESKKNYSKDFNSHEYTAWPRKGLVSGKISKPDLENIVIAYTENKKFSWELILFIVSIVIIAAILGVILAVAAPTLPFIATLGISAVLTTIISAAIYATTIALIGLAATSTTLLMSRYKSFKQNELSVA